MDSKKKTTLDKKVIDKEDENLVKELTPYFKEMHGKSAVINGIKFVRGGLGLRGLEYKISVEYKHKGKRKKKTHHVSIDLSSEKPMYIDGELTEYGNRRINSLAEYGEFMADCYS